MSTLVQKYGAVQPADPNNPGATEQLDEAALFAVITAAIHCSPPEAVGALVAIAAIAAIVTIKNRFTSQPFLTGLITMVRK